MSCSCVSNIEIVDAHSVNVNAVSCLAQFVCLTQQISSWIRTPALSRLVCLYETRIKETIFEYGAA
jgi:hypothetical protein